MFHTVHCQFITHHSPSTFWCKLLAPFLLCTKSSRNAHVQDHEYQLKHCQQIEPGWPKGKPFTNYIYIPLLPCWSSTHKELPSSHWPDLTCLALAGCVMWLLPQGNKNYHKVSWATKRLLPPLCFTSLVKLHFKVSCPWTEEDCDVMAIVVVVMGRFHWPRAQHYRLLLSPAFNVHLAFNKINTFNNSTKLRKHRGGPNAHKPIQKQFWKTRFFLKVKS